jgi:Cu+-exporting ATPase
MVTAARATKLRVERPTGFAAVPGLGVKATIGKSKVVVGRPVLLEQSGIDHSRSDGVSSDLEKEGKTAMAVAVDGKAVGVVAVADTVKPGARDTVEALKGGGIRVIMLTGDNDRTARAIASQVGIDEVESGVLPGQKSERIKALKGEGHVVAMVGDGINDAPALAQADLGIAIGTGTDVAIDSAGMVLIKDDLRDVVGALKLSRATMRKIRQNLFWAFAYNLVLIPVAATGFLNPILAGIAMALSSVSVLANSLSLNRLRLGPTSREALPARPAV